LNRIFCYIVCCNFGSPFGEGRVATEARKMQIALWRERAAEARSQADQMQDGSVSQTILITIAEAYGRLAHWEEQRLPRK